jgi:predicted Zn-dependent protease
MKFIVIYKFSIQVIYSVTNLSFIGIVYRNELVVDFPNLPLRKSPSKITSIQTSLLQVFRLVLHRTF